MPVASLASRESTDMTENTLPALRNFLLQRYDDLKRSLTWQLGSAERAGEALHDTWLRLESRGEIEGIQDVRAYLMRMAVNIAIDQHRSESRLLDAEEIDTLLTLPDPAPGPEQTTVARAELDILVEALKALPLRRRKILIMVRWEGLTQPAVAKKLGVSLRTVEKELKTAHDFCAARMSAPSNKRAG
jgi:RNA polymerase sigma factor (sigma-70 family)